MQNGYHRAYFIVCWIEFIIASMFILARCYTAWRLVRLIGADLYFSIATYVLGAGSMTMLSLAAAHGLGVSITVLSRDERNSALLYGWINQYIALIAIGLAKFAIVIFLSRIHGHQTRKRTIMLWFLAGSNMIVNIIAMILALVQCSPVTSLWNDAQPGECPGRKRVQIFGYVQGPYSAVVDFALALYPVLVFAKVQAFSISTRVGLCVLMGFGVIAGACAIVKTVKLRLLTNLDDVTHTLADVILWNETEMWVVFIVSCIPPTKVFFTLVIRKGTGGVNSIVRQIRSGKHTSTPTAMESMESRSC